MGSEGSAILSMQPEAVHHWCLPYLPNKAGGLSQSCKAESGCRCQNWAPAGGHRTMCWQSRGKGKQCFIFESAAGVWQWWWWGICTYGQGPGCHDAVGEAPHAGSCQCHLHQQRRCLEHRVWLGHNWWGKRYPPGPFFVTGTQLATCMQKPGRNNTTASWPIICSDVPAFCASCGIVYILCLCEWEWVWSYFGLQKNHTITRTFTHDEALQLICH